MGYLGESPRGLSRLSGACYQPASDKEAEGLDTRAIFKAWLETPQKDTVIVSTDSTRVSPALSRD